MKLRIKYNVSPWLFGRYRGIVLYPFILFKYSRDEVTESTMRHEMEHVYQMQQKGVLRWYLSYLIELIKNGYWNNKYEILARIAANQPLTEEERKIFYV